MRERADEKGCESSTLPKFSRSVVTDSSGMCLPRFSLKYPGSMTALHWFPSPDKYWSLCLLFCRWMEVTRKRWCKRESSTTSRSDKPLRLGLPTSPRDPTAPRGANAHSGFRQKLDNSFGMLVEEGFPRLADQTKLCYRLLRHFIFEDQYKIKLTNFPTTGEVVIFPLWQKGAGYGKAENLVPKLDREVVHGASALLVVQ